MELTETQISPLVEISKRVTQKLNRCGLQRLRRAHKTLAKLQQSAFSETFGEHELIVSENLNRIHKNTGKDDVNLISSDADTFQDDEELDEENIVGEEDIEVEEAAECSKISEDAWLGYFNGYEILDNDEKIYLNGNKQCVELSQSNSNAKMLDEYLRGGIRCFYLDLFHGTEMDKQRVIFNLRNSELRISQEFGFPVIVTLFAMLSPRCQYTGIFVKPRYVYTMERGEMLTLTTDRQYSNKGTRKKFYVNGRFFIDECQFGDFILIGSSLQVRIISIRTDELNCEVMEPGNVHSRSPVRFPGRCNRSRVSVEEIEDIAFAREMGINVLVSYIAGTELYLKELQNAMGLLNCQNMRLGCRLVLNELDNKRDNRLQWIIDGYDVFIMEYKLTSKSEEEEYTKHPSTNQEILNLTPLLKDFIKTLYDEKKPILLNVTPIAKRLLFVHPCNWLEIFHYVDKYIITDDQDGHDSFHFYLLQRAICNHMIPSIWSSTLYCDRSESGCDSIARSCIATSLECNAAAILVCAILPDMPINLSHFRPKVPIYFISPTKSSADYISMYHNVIYLYHENSDCHRKSIVKGFLYGLTYLKSRKIATNGQNLILMYSYNHSTDLPDKYLICKFNEDLFLENLHKLLFK
ncbi:pyruvate kinase [Musca autumnalis]|uniref:pyruvate kinase n=1 Tax=Musca autumnalis TaxID=221902 RepID=UPI003CF54020